MATHTDGVIAIRALAHPLRLRMLDLLRFNGPSTATLLGRTMGESSGSTSYHLRQLARHGFIEEVPATRSRQRWWRYCERPVTLKDEALAGGGRRILAELLTREAHALDGFLADTARAPEWDDAAFFRARALRLTVGELDEIRVTIEAVVGSLRAADAAGAPGGARPVRFLAFAYPVPDTKG